MNKELLDKISKEEAERLRTEIIEKLYDLPKFDKGLKEWKLADSILIYYLWKVKTDSSISSFDDLADEVQVNGCWMEVCDDAIGALDIDAKSFDRFRGIANEYSEEELASCILIADCVEDVTNELYYKVFPDSFGVLLDEFFDIKKNDKLLQINTSSYALETKQRHPNVSLELCDEIDRPMVSLLSFINDVMGNQPIDFSVILTESKGFDKVLISTNLGIIDRAYHLEAPYYIEEKWKDYPLELSIEWDYCAYAMTRLNKKGKAIAIMNGGLLTVNKYKRVREWFLEKKLIEGVIKLPDKMSFGTWVNPYIVILGFDNKMIRFLDASSDFIPERKKGRRYNDLSEEIIRAIVNNYQNTDICSEVSFNEVLSNDAILAPSRYIKHRLLGEKNVKLGEVIKEVKRGITLKASEMDAMISDETSDKPCIMPADISNGVVTSKTYFHGDLRKPGKNDADYNDVLIGKHGNPFNIAVSEKRYLVVGNTYILEVDRNKMDPYYLKCFLSSEAGQNELMKYATGATTPIISVQNLLKVEIPLYNEKHQREINERSKEIVKKLQDCYKEIDLCEQGINEIFV